MPLTQQEYQDFYNHPFIASIADREQWTISDNNKRPLDMFQLLYRHRVRGAEFFDRKSCVSLPQLASSIQNPANFAYALDALNDKFIVLDIEPACPDKLKQELLKLPYIYGEVSLSGQGYHLIFPLPDYIDEYPIAKNKIVMKEQHKYYEILLCHWCTFTGKIIPPSACTNDFEAFFRNLAAEQKESHRSDFNVEDIEPKDIPFKDNIVNTLLKTKFKKSLNDAPYYGDISRYEYGHIGFLYYKLKHILNVPFIKKSKHKYTESEKAWLLYLAAKERIEYRDKHDTQRGNLPWLLYLSQEIIAKDNTAKK